MPEAWPHVVPKYAIPKSGMVFTTGSCFARNIERHLARLGYEVPMLGFTVPQTEWKHDEPGIHNRYTPATIWQGVEWAAQAFDADFTTFTALCEPFAFRLGDDLVIDLGLGDLRPVSGTRFLARLAESRRQTALALAHAERALELAPEDRDAKVLRDHLVE